MQKKLNSRQWKLYNLIKEYSLNNIWLSRRDIQKILIDHYSIINDDLFNDGHARLITEDIQIINNSDQIHKVILSTSKGYKMATDEEYIDYMRSEKIYIFARLKRYYKKIKKFKKHNQMRLTFTKHEKNIIESIIEIEKENE